MTTQYYDARAERSYTLQELLDICNGTIKPYPPSWYASEQDIITYRNQCLKLDWQDDIEALIDNPDDEPPIWYWSRYRSPIQQWKLLRCDIL